MLNETAKTVLAIATLFDDARTKVKDLLPAGDGLNLVLTSLGEAERRAVRAFYAGEKS